MSRRFCLRDWKRSEKGAKMQIKLLYMEMNVLKLEYYGTEPVCDGVTRIHCAAGELCYLVEGTERAVLIDTGSGYRGLDETVRAITSRPVDVILTHGHRDHAGGIVQFERVYADMADRELLDMLADDEFRRGYPTSLKPKVFRGLGAEEFPRTHEPKLIPVADCDVMELGGDELEIWETPGHTAGSICILDRGRRLLFAGDTVIDCALLVFEQSCSVETYMKSLERIEAHAAEYDAMYCAHFDGIVPSGGIDSLLECCGDILAGRDEHVPAKMFRRSCFAARKPALIPTWRADGKWGNVFYK